jgi:peptidoglycan/LPS O-acetylase OafA/YrhL
MNPAADHRRADIQGLRALAVIAVIAFHAGLPVPGGFVGVDVFFVISGFVITAMLMREWASSGRIAFGTFYLRRFRRLTPALALMVGVTMIAAAFLLSPLGPQETAAQTGIGAMLLVANAVIAATTGGAAGSFPPSSSSPRSRSARSH